ncbi:LINE-1 retrotransposable element ORF2 protein [Cucumis melo var. makuwa]|uniref:LINE-1 retrotransposable element ORF2 protein n=1 Tax=Cucumis melo var. makuwa TaxID=1194695 RepID=A0A5D3DM72_CUCMM|nr:LINE-1 retrotransposable element ORF2 protein [Cucumis melo var. makuwa]TYK24727.1 LINE-1 retrotransposable element ORF2 protein [Cucumis melo var. makuwa]
MRCFNKFIADSNLIDPPLSNAKFTWSNLRVHPVLSRIDRFLYTTNWENLFTAHYSKTLSRVTSDHFPIVLESSLISWGPSPFKLINVHLKEPWFKNNVTNWWKNLRQEGHPGFSFMRKLKQLSTIIRNEQRKNKCYSDEDKNAWIKEIDSIDRLEAEGNLSEELSLRRTRLKADVLMSGFKEAQIWYQKSKRLWITEGDENTSFFHKICSARQRRSIISNINSVDGVPCSTNESIAKAFLDHFEDIYKGGGEESPWLIDNLNWSPISTNQAQNLCSMFTEEEIHEALTAFSNNKSPGPDGFTMEFYKSTWSVLKEEILNIFRDFHSNCIINKAVNITNIALIAKKEKCAEPADYRPISLTTSIYKLIAKVIAERLKDTLPYTVAENQMAFVKGRQIIDAILVANEAIDYWRVKKIQGFVIKLDIEKAFDKLNWRFIDFMLMKKGYPFKWRNWIRACISSVQYSIIINGRPRGKIQPSRGIRQGDPISPFIFVLAMDYMSRLLNSVGEKIKGVKLEGNINLTHLLFADDILLFVEDDEHSIQNLKNIINLFQLASGLSINLNKSTISPINVDASRTEQIASQWGISTKFLPINYLGVPLGGKQITKTFWKNVEEKINKKLASWKYSMLSKGGKITLIKSSLASLPTYQLSIFKAPVSTCKNIEKTWRNFLWKNPPETHKLHLVNWAKITSSKEKGGLGISRLKDTNFALLTKWLWRYIHEDSPLWKKIINAKYRSLSKGDIPCVCNHSSSRSPWFSICKGLEWFQRHVSWKIKNGRSFSFWHSHWHQNSPLSSHYPRLYALSTNKESSIRDMWNNTLMDWDLNPRRQLREWEHPLWAELKNSLNASFCENGNDSPMWTLNSNGLYTVASVKKTLQQPEQNLLDFQSQNTFKNLWKTSIPKKCIFFIWTLLYDSVNTAEQLMKRLPNLCSRPSWCVMCKRNDEDRIHLFILCPIAKSIWRSISSHLSSNVNCLSPKELCITMCSWKQKTKKNVILFNTYASALWNIWLERNARIFNGKEKTVAEIWEDIKALAGLWTSRSSLFSNYQASSIALNLNAFS